MRKPPIRIQARPVRDDAGIRRADRPRPPAPVLCRPSKSPVGTLITGCKFAVTCETLTEYNTPACDSGNRSPAPTEVAGGNCAMVVMISNFQRDRCRTNHVEAKGSVSFLKKRNKKLLLN
jgi:hypothetical protein